jgi:UMF1 family MFS transporter
MVFYNAYLPEIVPASRRGRVSAWGFGLGYAGSLVALAYAAPLAGAGATSWIWVVLSVQWVLAAVPAFRVLPPDRPTGTGLRDAAARGARDVWRTIRSLREHRDLAWFLLAAFLYLNGVFTVVHFATAYAVDTLRFEDAEAIGMLALVQVTALVGSFATAAPTDRWGPRPVVMLSVLWWVVVVTAAFLTTDKGWFYVVAALAGLGLGSIQSASRAFMAQLVPHRREAEFFGFYAMCGKTGAILGPPVFGLVSWLVGDQRPAILSVIAFYAAGLLCLVRVRAPDVGRPLGTGDARHEDADA